MTAAPMAALFMWLQQASPRALLLAMSVAYLLCFAGLVFAYLSYRRRRKSK